VKHSVYTTQVRLNKIRLAPTDLCILCNNTDTLQHRLTECGEGQQIRELTQKHNALILRTDWRRISAGWMLQPSLKLWPQQKHRAVLWLLAKFVLYRLQTRRTPIFTDYYDFLCRVRWKIDRVRNREKCVGKSLNVIPMDAYLASLRGTEN
jgi:hypothetical protein